MEYCSIALSHRYIREKIIVYKMSAILFRPQSIELDYLMQVSLCCPDLPSLGKGTPQLQVQFGTAISGSSTARLCPIWHLDEGCPISKRGGREEDERKNIQADIGWLPIPKF